MDTLLHLADRQPLPVFAAGAALSLAASWVLVSRIERFGRRLGLTGALLGILAALAADMPEVTSAITASARHEPRIGAGVIVGANLFQVAALLGLGSVLAGRIALRRDAVALSGLVGASAAITCLAVVVRAIPPIAGLAVMVAVFLPYLAVLLRHRRREGEGDGEDATDRPAAWGRDAVVASGALVVVLAASVSMERAASALGRGSGLPDLVVGGLGLAIVTSLPNSVAAIYLAARGRGTAVLSTAVNSAAINLTFGLLAPAAIIGLGRPSGQTSLVAAWYVGLSLTAQAIAFRNRGLSRRAGLVLIGGYLVFVATLLLGS